MTRAGASRALGPLALSASVLTALWLVGGTAIAMWMYGFGELHADQFNQYRTLLDNEFLLGLVLPANGHRHIVSNLVRWLDIVLGRGDQTAGIIAGMLAWLGAWLILSWQVWRATADAVLLRAAALLLCALGLAWMGSARVQLHGNEAPQVYFVVCCALLAMACIAERARADAGRWSLALLFGVLGMLAFGSGVAIFGGLLALAVALRHPPLRIAAASAAAVAAVLVYSVLLPGGDSVRSTLTLQPLVVIGNAATWLGSAITTGWLVWGAEGAFGADAARFSQPDIGGAWLVASARGIRALAGEPSTATLAQVCGGAGLVLLAGFTVAAWWRPTAVSPLGRIGLGLALFAAALAGLVSVGRSDYFVTFPAQLLADRYVMWTALFWLGLALCVLAALAPRTPAAAWALLLATLGVLLLALPSHRVGAAWGRAAAQVMEMRAAQAQSGVLLPGWPDFSNLGDIDEVEAFLRFYRDHEQAMFRTPRSRLFGAVLPAGLLAAADGVPPIDWYPHAAEVVQPENPLAEEAWHVAGHLFATREAGEGVVAVDGDGRVVGLGEFSYDHVGPFWQRLGRAGLGFDLYFRSAPAACPAVRLYRIDDAASRLQRLAALPCARPPAGG